MDIWLKVIKRLIIFLGFLEFFSIKNHFEALLKQKLAL